MTKKLSEEQAHKYIVAIESSCDDTSAAVLCNTIVLSNETAGQEIHQKYGGVVPELASRAHQANILPVVHIALEKAGISLQQVHAIAFTSSPGLLGSLLVGSSFAKGMALSLQKPVIAVDHMTAHVMALFLDRKEVVRPKPNYPFLCLTVSGGHTQIALVTKPNVMEIVGKTKDDAAGEAFDKIAKMLQLPYPGGPWIDKYAQNGNPLAFTFPKSNMKDFDFSFSGIKTAVLYFLEENVQKEPDFIQKHLADICASAQHVIVEMLLKKVVKASLHYQIKEIAIAGGVSANSYLRKQLHVYGQKYQWKTYIPDFEFCTDNAAMIGITAYYKLLEGEVNDMDVLVRSR